MCVKSSIWINQNGGQSLDNKCEQVWWEELSSTEISNEMCQRSVSQAMFVSVKNKQYSIKNNSPRHQQQWSPNNYRSCKKTKELQMYTDKETLVCTLGMKLLKNDLLVDGND